MCWLSTFRWAWSLNRGVRRTYSLNRGGLCEPTLRIGGVRWTHSSNRGGLVERQGKGGNPSVRADSGAGGGQSARRERPGKGETLMCAPTAALQGWTRFHSSFSGPAMRGLSALLFTEVNASKLSTKKTTPFFHMIKRIFPPKFSMIPLQPYQRFLLKNSQFPMLLDRLNLWVDDPLRSIISKDPYFRECSILQDLWFCRWST